MKYYKVTDLWLVEYKNIRGEKMYASNKKLSLAVIEAFVEKNRP